MVTGIVEENTLEQTVLDVGDFPSAQVQRIEWGDVPTSFKDAVTYYERAAYDEAAAQFLLAAGDSDARDVVRAAARRRAVDALIRAGSGDTSRFSQAADEAQRFLTDYTTNRDVPQVQVLAGRAQWLAGKAAEGGQTLREVFGQWSGEETPAGYDREVCLRAGLWAARALLDAKDTLAAREVFTQLDTTVSGLLAELDPADSSRASLVALRDEALLGEGFAELAADNHKTAITFFRNKLNGSDLSDTLRYGASLGLARGLLRDGAARDAQVLFAKVAALDHTDGDRVAWALVGAAEAAMLIKGKGDEDAAARWLDDVLSRYGDTPAAARAREIKN